MTILEKSKQTTFCGWPGDTNLFSATMAGSAGSPAVADEAVSIAELSPAQSTKGSRKIAAALAAAFLIPTATAQVPDQLKFSVNSRPAVPQAALFGTSVAVNDRYLVAGAPHDNTGARRSGGAKVFDPVSGALLFELKNPAPAEKDLFGLSAAVSGSRVVVGAPNDDEGATDAGSAYVYDLRSATPTVPVLTLHNPEPGQKDDFGDVVAISGSMVIVAAASDSPQNAGSVYVYKVDGEKPEVPVLTLRNPDTKPVPDSFFGLSLAISGMRLVVGVPYGNDSIGSVYVYDLGGNTPSVPIVALHNPGPQNSTLFGTSVAISGTRVVVGTPGDDTGAQNAGSAYVFELTRSTPAIPVATLHNPDPESEEQFGGAVAISGPMIAVGTYADDTGGSDAGITYVYNLDSGTPLLPLAKLKNPAPAASDYFGFKVAIAGTTVVVGAPNDDTAGTDEGTVYVFGPENNDTDADGLADSWEIIHFGSLAGHGPLDDADHDGNNELMEEAFGSDPLVPDAGDSPAMSIEGGYLAMVLTKYPGVHYEVQSGDLLTGNPFRAATTTVILDTASTLKVRDNVLTGTAPARFLRVKVTAAP
jgi:hypothetical protein